MQHNKIAMDEARHIDAHRLNTDHQQDILRLLDQVIDTGITITNSDLDLVYFNQFVAKTLGISPQELKAGDNAQKIFKLMVEKGLISQKDAVQRLGQAKQAKEAPNQGVAQGNIETMVFSNGQTHLMERHQTPSGLTISVSHNVTALKEQEKMLEAAMVHGDSGYWEFDFETKTINVSDSLRTILGEEQIHALNTKGVMAIIHPDYREEFKNCLRKSHKTDDIIDYTYKNIDGSRWYRTTGKSSRGENGNLRKLTAFMKDITKIKQQEVALNAARDQAIAASRAKSEFLANMSHEIRTPMNGVLGMIELLRETNLDERQQEFIRVISNSSNALLTIINDILDFSKIEAGALELDPVGFNLRDSIQDITSLLNTQAHEKGLEIIVNYPPDMETMFIADAGRLRQVMTNIVGNAIKFTEHGHILLLVDVQPVSETQAELNLTISDTGIGIEQEKLANIFDKFTQADSSTTRLYGGTGLGLAISKRIINLMGGDMTVSSTLGEGSAFSIKLPIKIDETVERPKRTVQSLAGRRALIVDDIDINRNILEQRLASWQMDSVSVADGVEALVALKTSQKENNPFDVILLDFLMPGMNGYELATFISGNATLHHIPIVMLSSCDKPVSTSDLDKVGIEQYLTKPVRDTKLYDTLSRIFGTATVSGPEPKMAEMPPPRPSDLMQIDQSAARSAPSLDDDQNIQPASRATKIKVLIAEDFPLNQDVVQLMLDESSYLPVFANNGQECLDAYMAMPSEYSAILMDISMPVMDGYEATEKIREFQQANPQLKETPIIALTGHALKHDRENCLEADMNDYLTKPVKQDDLIAMLNKWVLGEMEPAQSA